MTNIKIKVVAWVIAGAVSLIFASIMFLINLVFFDEPFLSYKNPVFKVDYGKEGLSPFRPGQVVPLLLERCNKSNSTKTYKVAHSLLDQTGAFTILPTVDDIMLAPGCHKDRSTINRLPKELPSGTYKIIGSTKVEGVLLVYYINWESENFEVVN